MGPEAEDRHRRPLPVDRDLRARHPDLGAAAPDRARCTGWPCCEHQHEGERPRQGALPDAHRPRRDARAGVSAPGLGGRQVPRAGTEPAARLHPHPARRGRSRRTRGGVPRSQVRLAQPGQRPAPANTARPAAIGDAGRPGARPLGSTSTTASPDAGERPRPKLTPRPTSRPSN